MGKKIEAEVMKREQVTIVYATNDSYAPYMGVSIYSLISNTSRENYYKIYILQKNLSVHHKDRILSLKQENVDIEILDVSELMNGKSIPQIAYLSEEATYRILIGKMFSSFEKVLYIDCDTIVNKDVAELYKEDITEYILGVALDNLSDSLAERIRKVVDVPLDKYFNSGMLLINIPLFLKHKIEDKCFQLLQSGVMYPTLDQDVLNITCKGLTKRIDGRWNAQWAMAIDSKSEYMRKEQINDLQDPYIIHYVSGCKPWGHPEFVAAEYFWNYARKTDFYEEILFKNTKGKTVEINPFQRFVFPWDIVEPEEDVIIYGAGVVGRTFLKQIDMSQYCCIKAVCDKKSDSIMDLNCPVISINRINEFEFDKLIVAIEKETVAQEIIEELKNNSIDIQKVFWKDYRRK